MSFYVECSFQNTLLELNNRLRRDDNLPGYTLGMHGNKFVVVNDGGDHGNVAFRQAITILSHDDCTAGAVFITARIEEHENYELFDKSISPTLNDGISRLQETAFLIVYTKVGRQIVPVP